MGAVSFPAEEEPLGSIHVRITGGERVIDWLAPQTENGIPILETEPAELSRSDGPRGQRNDGPDGREGGDV